MPPALLSGLRPQRGPQEAFLTSMADIAIYGGAAGGGKLLECTTNIATPTGFRAIIDLCAGDAILGRDGQVHSVLATSEPETAPAYRLTFDDGSTLIAHDEHLWLTYDARELAALTRLTDEWRARRRTRRPSRRTGKKSERFTASITARNRATPPPTAPTPTGTIRTTAQIADTLHSKQGRVNHAIPVAEPLNLQDRNLPIDPYVLGLWLGDGSSESGEITTMDEQVVTAVVAAGFPLETERRKPNNRAASYGFEGFRALLREHGLQGNKHIPDEYLWASKEQRLALLQGLMDTDGCIANAGQAEFCNTNERLVEGTLHLIRSLGHKARAREGRATLRGKDCGPKWTIKFSAHLQVFRLPRKAEKLILSTRRTTRFHYVVNAERVDPARMRCIQVSAKDGLYLAGDAFIATHNSFGLVLDDCYHVDNPGYTSAIFRRTYPQIMNPGGLWDTALEIYPHVQGKPVGSEWKFPSGAVIKFAHMQHEQDKLSWQGSQLTRIGFDELDHFSESQFFYMLSRNRSTSGIRPYIRATTNANADSWVADLISWWIDQDTGFPIPERAGVTRWFVRDSGTLLWSDDPQGLPWIDVDMGDGTIQPQPPKSFTFIPAKVTDNMALLSKDPGYLANLLAMPEIDQARLLHGNWKIRVVAGMYFKRHWLPIVPDSPRQARRARFWDTAATEKTKENKDPDWTVGLLLAEDDGRYWIEDVVRVRSSPGDVEKVIAQTAEMDGHHIDIYMEQEPGASGKMTADHYRRRVLKGYPFHAIPAGGSKMLRAKPASAAAEGGNLMLVKGEWNKTFIEEAVAFDLAPHDDQVDALSGSFLALSKPRISGRRSAVSGPREVITNYRPY